jgi:uncharacterized protein
MSKIHLGTAATGEQVYIDIPTLITTRMLVTASSGGGKSETLRRILEEACGHVQCIVIDPEGEFSTLREKKPFVLVGEGGETTADIRTAALVATRLLELNVSAVCDLYEMRVQDRHEWVKRFLDSMVHAPKSLWHPVIVVIDEAHQYCPERGYSESVASQSIIDLANLGRKRGFCPILATQRLSKLNKNAVEPLQNYLAGRTTFDDQARAASVFKIAPGKDTREFSLELERLEAGQFISRGRSITGDMLKVNVIRGATRPPATGTAMAGVVTPTPDAVRALLPKLADLPKEAEKKEQTEEDLRREIATAKQRISELERLEGVATRGIIASKDLHIQQLEDQATRYRERFAALRVHAGALDAVVRIIGDEPLSVEYRPEVPVSLKLKPQSEWPRPSEFPPLEIVTSHPPCQPLAARPRPSGSGSPMPKACRMVLTALAQHGQCSKSRIAALTGYAVNGGGFNNALSECRTKGWIEGSDPITVTRDGLSALGPVEPLPSGAQLLEMWSGKLGKAEREILNALARNRAGIVTKGTLAEVTGYAENGGGFNNAISRLRTLELVEGRGEIRLTSDFARAIRG